MAKFSDEEVQKCVDDLTPLTRKQFKEMDEFSRAFYPTVVAAARYDAARLLPVVWRELIRLRKKNA